MEAGLGKSLLLPLMPPLEYFEKKEEKVVLGFRANDRLSPPTTML